MLSSRTNPTDAWVAKRTAVLAAKSKAAIQESLADGGSNGFASLEIIGYWRGRKRARRTPLAGLDSRIGPRASGPPGRALRRWSVANPERFPLVRAG